MQPSMEPPPFDQPMIRKCIKTSVRIQNHESLQEVLILTTVLCSVESQLNKSDIPGISTTADRMASSDDDMGDYTESSDDYSDSDDSESNTEDRPYKVAPQSQDEERYKMKAFWLRKDPIRENHHGVFSTHIYYAKVLRKADLYWACTNEEVAIKRVSWKCIQACRNRISEDFIKEISALQYLAQWRAAKEMSITDIHVMTADTVMCDESYLYIVMPFCRGGDLCQRVAEVDKFSEDESRFWFRQILKGLETLQMAKVCHRDLSPENFIILHDKSLVIDFGMCLRIPYVNEQRHKISARPPCGKLPHMSPEVFRKLDFDGHAIDIWAAGTVLLFMLTGKRLSNPPLIDRAFEGVELSLSYHATDLLRKMFRLDPKDRLTLEQIKEHPFVTHQFL